MNVVMDGGDGGGMNLVNILYISSKYICDQVIANSFIQKLSN